MICSTWSGISRQLEVQGVLLLVPIALYGNPVSNCHMSSLPPSQDAARQVLTSALSCSLCDTDSRLVPRLPLALTTNKKSGWEGEESGEETTMTVLN